jgi:hypothetical protein
MFRRDLGAGLCEARSRIGRNDEGEIPSSTKCRKLKLQLKENRQPLGNERRIYACSIVKRDYV